MTEHSQRPSFLLLVLYLDETIATLIENHLVMDAFALTGMVFTEAVSQEMDDSDGGLSLVISDCNAYWGKLIPSPEADQTKMLAWFESKIREPTGDIGEEYLWQAVFEHFTDLKLLPKIALILDKRIETADEYALQGLVEQRIALMQRMGASAGEIENYRRKFWDKPFIRKQVLDRLEAEEKWSETLALLEECERLDWKEGFLLAEYARRRLRILKRSGQESAWLSALKQYIFSFPQWDMEYVAELKRAVPPEEWPGLIERLFRNENTKGLRRELQLSEGLLEEMMAELEESSYPYELARYEKDLRKRYPERVRDLLLRQLDAEMRRASTRGAYAKIAQSLKHLYGYPEGRERVAELTKTWRQGFPRRSAMLEELKKVKL